MAALTELWHTPGPSSGFLDGVALQILPGRVCVLSFRYEGTNTNWEKGELRFLGVATYKCTSMLALTVDMVESAYDKLVDMGSTPWLLEVATAVDARGGTAPLKHLRICFDDGPCYDVICTGFEPQP